MNITKDKLTTFHRFQILLISVFKWIKKLFYNFTCFIINHDFYVITFWMHYTHSPLSMEEVKLFPIVNWIFHESDILRLCMKSFKYGLIKYLSTDSALFLSPLLSYLTYLLLKKLLTFWFIIIFFSFIIKKVSNISKYYIFNCFIFFFSLKRFLMSLIIYSSSGLGFSIIYVVKKINYFLKNKSLLHSLKSILKFWWF